MDVKIVWAPTTSVQVPAGSDLSQYKAEIAGFGSQFVAFGVTEATFANVPPGDYMASVSLSNAAGDHTEATQSGAFTVPQPPPESRDAPGPLTITLV